MSLTLTLIHAASVMNMTEPSVCSGDAALCQITLTSCYFIVLLGRITVLCTWMLPVVTDRLVWSVCLSVSLSVCHSCEPHRKWLNRSSCRLCYGLKEPCIRWGRYPLWEGAVLKGGKCQPIVENKDYCPCAVAMRPFCEITLTAFIV